VSESMDNDWTSLPMMLKVEEAAAVLRVARSTAYELATAYLESGGMTGLPVLRVGSVLRVPRFALLQLVTTGQLVMLRPPVPV
jgi:Helix-turn-helix domain